ncbi:MAG: tetratricopeptide repeat protein [Bernardetiaceae bacterium]|nr:tetratricopeptide repeat protein [Bernardetiaceae bacterium]
MTKFPRILFWLCCLGLSACENRYLSGEKVPPPPQQAARSWEQRVAFMTQVIEQHPNEADYFYRRATTYLEGGKENLALTDVEQALALDSANQDYFFLQAKLLDDKQDHQQAYAAAARAQALGYQSPELTWLLGKLSYLNQQPAKAQVYLQTSLNSYGERPETYYYLGLLGKDTRDTAQAVTQLERAITLRPTYAEAHQALVDFYLGLGKNRTAAGYARRGLSLCPENPDLYQQYAHVLERLDEPDAAIGAYRRVVELDPERWQASYRLFTYYLNKRRYALAAMHLRNTLRAKPDLEGGYLTLANISYHHLDQYDEALKYFKLAQQARPQDPAIALAIAKTEKKIEFEAWKLTPEGQAWLRRRREAERASDSTGSGQ